MSSIHIYKKNIYYLYKNTLIILEVSERLKDVTVRKPPSASLLSYYKQSWKSTQYHFQR